MWVCKATYQHDSQCDHFSSGPHEVYQAQGPMYSFFLKKLKLAAETCSIWHKSNTGRVYQKRILLLFTVLGLTVQVFLEMFNRTKVREKRKKEKTAGTADVNVVWVFFLIIIFILPKSLKSTSGLCLEASQKSLLVNTLSTEMSLFTSTSALSSHLFPFALQFKLVSSQKSLTLPFLIQESL